MVRGGLRERPEVLGRERLMNPLRRLRFLHSAWRYRLRTERFPLSFLLSRDLEGTTAIDIGANRGIYSYWLHRRVGSTGRVIAFEPQPELQTHLAELRDSFGLTRLEIAGVGLSSECGELTLRRRRSHWGGASFDLHREERDDLEAIPVEVTTLDAYLQRRAIDAPVRFIKCDIEGHELPALRGSARTLAEDRPDVLFECHDAANPDCTVFSFLRSLDYEGFCFVGNGLAPVSEYAALRSRIHRKALADFVFLPRERALGSLDKVRNEPGRASQRDLLPAATYSESRPGRRPGSAVACRIDTASGR